MPRFIIKLDREKCIGAGACEEAAPQFWKLEGEKITLIGGITSENNSEQTREIDEAAFKMNLRAAEGCPVNAIHIIEKESGKKLI